MRTRLQDDEGHSWLASSAEPVWEMLCSQSYFVPIQRRETFLFLLGHVGHPVFVDSSYCVKKIPCILNLSTDRLYLWGWLCDFFSLPFMLVSWFILIWEVEPALASWDKVLTYYQLHLLLTAGFAKILSDIIL